MRVDKKSFLIILSPNVRAAKRPPIKTNLSFRMETPENKLERKLLERVVSHTLEYRADDSVQPVYPATSPAELRQHLDKPLPAAPSDPIDVIDQLVADVEGGLVRSTSGRFFGWVMGGNVPAALAADWMTSTWDQNAGMYAVAPAAAIVEEVCGKWLLDLLGLDETCSFALVTGCQMAHVTCLAAARNALLNKRGWDVEQKGLYGTPPIRIVTGDQRHGSIERALRLLGMGQESIIDIPCGADGKLSPSDLESALAGEPDRPTIVLLQAGDINSGSFDSYDELIPIARKYDAWVHVDGAFGLWAQVSPAHKHLTKGIEAADSWATDGHKWLNVPYDSGYAFVANREAHFKAFSHKANYLQYSDSARDQVDWNPEYSRRARGFATYAAIASLGREGIQELVTNACAQATAIVMGADRFPDVEVLCEPIINQGLLRFLDLRPGASVADHDKRTKDVIAKIVKSGEVFFSPTTWKGMRCMRVSVSGWNTTDDDVRRVLAAIEQSLLNEA